MNTEKSSKELELTPLAEAKEHIEALLCPENPEEWTPYSLAVVEKLIAHFPQTENVLPDICELKLHVLESALRFAQREPELYEDELFDVLFLTFIEISEVLSFIEDEKLIEQASERLEAIISTIEKIDKEQGAAFREAIEDMISEEDDEDDEDDDSCSSCSNRCC